ncbi:tyrosine-type recombinase/integrase [Vibrio fluvialis]|nr:site-specific integrase [Vibrio fluvialis]
MKYLTLRNETYYFNYKIPKKALPFLTGEFQGKTVIQKSLRTDSLREARKARDLLLAQIKGMESSIDTNPEKVRLRELVEEIREKYLARKSESEFMEQEEAFNFMQGFYDNNDPEREVRINKDPVKAAAILIATDEETDGTTLLDGQLYSIKTTLQEAGKAYITDFTGRVGGTTLTRTKKVLEYFKQFNNNSDTNLSDIKRVTVVAFIRFLQERSLSDKSISNYLSCLTQVWRFARDRQESETLGDSPFRDHTFKRNLPPSKPERRPYTIDEFKTLQTALTTSKGCTYARSWVMPIALVSGLRIEELLGLRKSEVVKDAKSGRWFFDVNENHRQLKTKAAVRRVPIHSSVLKAVLKIKEQSTNEFLFDEVIRQKDGNKSGTIGTWFSRIKTRTFPDTPELVFHSLRRHLSTALDNQGVELGLVQSLMGHERGSITFDTYSSGKRFEILCETLDKATPDFSDFIKCFPD